MNAARLLALSGVRPKNLAKSKTGSLKRGA